MTERMQRPPYILAHAADNAGCGTHRIMRPLELMTKAGIAAGRVDMALWPPEQLKQLNPDVVIWQRQHEDMQLQTMMAYREALPGAFIVYELDDALGAVPDDSFHKPFIPVDVETRVAKAVALCDAVSVSTRAMASYMRRICGDGIDVRIVPNMLGKDDFATAAAVRKSHAKMHLRPRIGWGGGISHKGDLALIKDAVVATASEVEWVFLGMKPDVDVPVEFHEGVPPRDYLAKLASLDLDLVVAPIEDNLFNRCKSNLRLIEAGVCGYGVIASAVEPYLDSNPPISYASTPDDWIAKIREFAAEGWSKRGGQRGDKMRAWAEKHFCFESNGEERLKGWLPKGAKPFRSRQVAGVSSTLTILCPIPANGLELLGNVVSTAAEAYASSTDVIYLRPGTIIQRDSVQRLAAHLAKVQAASVSSLSNDGGLCGFPRFREFSQIDPGHGQELDKLAAANFDGLDLDLPFPSGPMILLSRRAMNAVGTPEIGPDGSEEELLVRWGMMAQARGFRNKVAADVFVTAMVPKRLPFEQIVQREMMRWPPQNVASDPLPDIRARLEIEFHKLCYRLPLHSQGTTYDDWAAYFDSPGERDIAAMRKIVTGLENPVMFGLLLPDEATVEPQAWSRYKKTSRETIDSDSDADWYVFMWPGATLRSHALYEFARAIAANPDARFIYADHDTISLEGVRSDHSFKPNLDKDLLLGRDYVTPICAFHKSLIEGWNGSKIGDVEAYILALGEIDSHGAVVHIPRILAHLPPNSAQHELRVAKKKREAANGYLNMRGMAARVEQHPRFPSLGLLTFAKNYSTPAPLVSIIVPTKDKVEMLSPCLATLTSMTTYPNYEVLVIDNGSTRPEMVEYLNKARAMPRVRVIAWPFEYNWSALNNFAAGEAKGEYLVFLNDDTRIMEPSWLDEMVGCADRPGVGAVGARLVYPHSLIQHVGVICQRGFCGHSLKGLQDGQPGYQGLAVLGHDATAVTGACLLIKRSLYEGAGKLDETLVHNFNDVAICLQLNRMGYRNVVAMRAQLQHYEGVTRTNALSPEGLKYLQQEAAILCAKFPEPDPYWNNNLVVSHMNGGATVAGLNYDQIAWPGIPWEWRGADWKIDRVAMIGDDDRMASRIELGQGNVVYRLQIDGHVIRFTEPALNNVPACDIREPAPFKAFLDLVGIDRIVLRSIAGMPIEILGFIARLGRPVEYVPNTAESVCPRRDMKVNNQSCGEGWRHGNCQACVDQHGSNAGFVSIPGWRHLWAEFLARTELDVSGLGVEARSAVEHIFYSESAEPLRLSSAG